MTAPPGLTPGSVPELDEGELSPERREAIERLQAGSDEDRVAPGGIVSVQDALAEWDCKTPGCVGVARINKGMYAYLCDHCRGKKVLADREERAQNPPQPRARPATAPGDTEAASGLVDAVKALEAPAKHLERALTRRRSARADAAAALDDFQAALKTVRETAERLLT